MCGSAETHTSALTGKKARDNRSDAHRVQSPCVGFSTHGNWPLCAPYTPCAASPYLSSIASTQQRNRCAVRLRHSSISVSLCFAPPLRGSEAQGADHAADSAAGTARLGPCCVDKVRAAPVLMRSRPFAPCASHHRLCVLPHGHCTTMCGSAQSLVISYWSLAEIGAAPRR